MHLRTRLLLAATFALGMTEPVWAADGTYYPPVEGSPLYSPTPMITADVTGSLGWLKEGNVSSGTGTLGARLNMPLHDGWNLEPDIGLAATFDPSVTVFGGVAHLYKNLPGAALGGFVGGFQTSSSFYTQSTFTLGAELALYTHPNSIFGAQLGYGWVSDGTSYPSVGGYWDYFFTPDLKGTIGANWIGGYSGLSSTTVGTLALTKHWAGTPWSAYVSGSVADVSGTTASVALIGATWGLRCTRGDAIPA